MIRREDRKEKIHTAPPTFWAQEALFCEKAKMKIFSIPMLRVAKEIKLRNVPTSLSLDRESLYVSHKNGEVVRIDMEDGARERMHKEKRPIGALAVIGDSTVFGDKKGAVKILRSRAVTNMHSRHSKDIRDIYVRGSNPHQVLVSSRDKRISVWEVSLAPDAGGAVCTCVETLYGPKTAISSIDAIEGSSDLLCTSELSNTARLFKVGQGKQLLFRADEEDHLNNGAFLTPSLFVASSTSNCLYVFDTSRSSHLLKTRLLAPESGEMISRIRRMTESTFVVGCKNGAVLVVEYKKDCIRVIDRVELGDVIVNDVVVFEDGIIVCTGKEERESRVVVRKSSRNAVVVMRECTGDRSKSRS